MTLSAPPWPCPSCEQAAGYAFLTTTIRERPRAVVVRVRCKQCAHEWEMEHDPDGAVPDPDTEPERHGRV